MNFTFFTLLSVFRLFGDSSVNINIRIEGLPVNIIRVYIPNNHFFNTSDNLNFYDIKGENNFNIEIPLITGSFIELKINNESYIIIAASPGDSLAVKVKRNQIGSFPDYTYSFSGDNAVAHSIYTEKFYPAGKNLGFLEDLPKKTNAYADYFLKSKHYIDSVTSVWDSLYRGNQIKGNIYQLYKADTKGCLYDVAIRRMSLVKTRDTGWVKYTQWLNLKQVMYYYSDAGNPIYRRTFVGKHVYETYLSDIFEKDSSVTDTILRASERGNYYYYDTSFREEIWGSDLLAYRKLFSTTPQGIADYKAFEKYYPNSIYLKILKNYNDSLLSERKSVPGKIVINNSDYKNLKDLLNSMQGRYFFIDLWATWCIPCIQEFNSYTSISKYLNSVNITKVFLSIDEKKDTQKWKDFINDQHLAGYHFIINDTIQKQLFNIISEGKPESSLFIPQYLLYDKITDTFSIDLPRPSTLSVLQLVIGNLLKGDHKETKISHQNDPQ